MEPSPFKRQKTYYKLENTEMKYFDTEKNYTVLVARNDWFGTNLDPVTFDSLCNPVKGTGVNERIGRSIKIHKIKVRGQVNCAVQVNAVQAESAASCRLALVRDKQTNATQMLGSQVFRIPQVAITTVNATQSFQSLDTLGRFEVLKDMFFKIEPPEMVYDGTNIEINGTMYLVEWNITFKEPIKVHFNETNGGTIADIIDNSFHIIGCASNLNLAPSIVYTARVNYTDK